jgi:hypothetical protein
MDAKLQKIKTIFTKIKDTRIQVMNVFGVLEVKLTKLKNMTADFIKSNHDILFVFGLDSFKFQSKLIDFEYADMQKYFYALNNRMYCEYYKLFKIVSEYVDKTIGTNKTFEMIKSNCVFPIYKDLEPYKQYNFETIEEVHKTIILLLGGIQEHIVMKETELENYRVKQHSGLNINNFVNTFLFNVTMIKHNLGLFISYLDFFHNIHMKHFKRFSKKMKSMDDYLNEDITFDDSNPRRKTSRDFDDTLSQVSSISSDSSKGGGGGGAAAVPIAPTFDQQIKAKALPRKSETKSSLLKNGINTVMNTFRAFGSKPVNSNNISSNNSVSSINSYNSKASNSNNSNSNNSNSNSNNNNGNLNLHIDEKSTNILDTIAPLSDFNATNLTRERADTIKEQLNNDPKYMDKMFFQLTKTLDESDDEKEKEKEKEDEEKYEDNEEEKEEEPDDDNFGVAIVADLDDINEPIGKKKETIGDLQQNTSEDIDVKPDESECVAEGNKNEKAIEPFLKKKRGKKKK